MDDPNELYRHLSLAQQKAEPAGFVRTAAAAKMLLQGSQVDADVIQRLSDASVAQPLGGLRIVRQTRH